MGADLEAMTLNEILRRWPQTAAVLRSFGMSCPGCAMADFYGVRIAARIYGIAPQLVLEAISRTIDTQQLEE